MNTPHQVVNPWTWQDQFGFSQAVTATSPSRLVFCAGQASVDADGAVLHSGDIGAQVTRSFDNLETVLRQADTDLSHVVRLTVYTTDVDTLLGVARLAFPDMLVEIEATAVVP
jgi:enamine deaminase RidA (YjgF/YER057c/UK114 family)